MKKISCSLKYSLLTSCFLWPLLFVWQGLDFTDMGFWLTGYQQFYDGSFGLGNCWLSNFIGHWTGSIFGDTVVVYRLAFVVVIGFTAVLTWRILRAVVDNETLLCGTILITIIFAARSVGNWIGYNNLTALFYVGGAGLLFYGLTKEKGWYLCLAGLVLAANLFVRLPNLLGIALISAIWVWAWSKRWSSRAIITASTLFLTGFIAGVSIVGIMIWFAGHWQLYMQGLADTIGMAGDASSHHAGGMLLKMLIVDHIKAISFGIGSVALGVSAASLLRRLPNRVLFIFMVFGSAVLLVGAHYRPRWLTWIVPGFCYVVLAMTVYRNIRTNSPLGAIAFIAGLVLFLSPLGSGNGMGNAVYGMFLALPLSLMIVWEGRGVFWGQFRYDRRAGKLLVIPIAIALGVHAVYTAWNFTYRDSHNRLAMTSTIDHPKLRATFTTEERTEVVQELINALEGYCEPGDEILAYNSIGLIHFITETKPWLGHPWPTLLSSRRIESLISAAMTEKRDLPVVVRANISTRAYGWPNNAEFYEKRKQRAIKPAVFTSFLKKCSYKPVWTNRAFEILIREQAKL